MGFPFVRFSRSAAFAMAAALALPVAAGAQQNGSPSVAGAPSASTSPAVTVPTPASAPPQPSASVSASVAAGSAPPAAEGVAGLGATPAASPDTSDADEAEEAEEWAERDRLVNESNTITGGTGLLKTQHAQTGAPGQLRIGFVSEWFSAGFLCNSQYPCPNPTRGGPALTSDTIEPRRGNAVDWWLSALDRGWHPRRLRFDQRVRQQRQREHAVPSRGAGRHQHRRQVRGAGRQCAPPRFVHGALADQWYGGGRRRRWRHECQVWRHRHHRSPRSRIACSVAFESQYRLLAR